MYVVQAFVFIVHPILWYALLAHSHFCSICLFCFVLYGLCLCACVTLELMSFVRGLLIIFGNETICFLFCLNFAYRIRSLSLSLNMLDHRSGGRLVGCLVPIVFSTNNVSITQDHIPSVSAVLCSARLMIFCILELLIVALVSLKLKTMWVYAHAHAHMQTYSIDSFVSMRSYGFLCTHLHSEHFFSSLSLLS